MATQPDGANNWSHTNNLSALSRDWDGSTSQLGSQVNLSGEEVLISPNPWVSEPAHMRKIEATKNLAFLLRRVNCSSNSAGKQVVGVLHGSWVPRSPVARMMGDIWSETSDGVLVFKWSYCWASGNFTGYLLSLLSQCMFWWRALKKSGSHPNCCLIP